MGVKSDIITICLTSSTLPEVVTMDQERANAILNGVKQLKANAAGPVTGKETIRKDMMARDSTSGSTLASASASISISPATISASTASTSASTSACKTLRDARQIGKSFTSSPPLPSSSQRTTHRETTDKPKKPIGLNSLVVSPRQKGNPLLQHIRNIPWKYGDINADYVTGATSCVLFLSLKYHRLHPEYIYTRMKKLGRDFELRIILVLVDVENQAESMRELSKTSMYNDFTVVACWSSVEAANYLSQLKLMETSSPAAIQGIVKEDYNSQLIEVMGKIRGINKNDAISLVTYFGSFKNAVLQGGENIEMIPGWGETKAKRFKAAVTEPFVFNKEYSITEDTYRSNQENGESQ